MTSETRLNKAETGSIYEVVAVPEVELLKSLGIRPGASVRVICRYPLGGPTLLSVEESGTVAVGKDIATLVTVSPWANHTPERTEDVA